MKQLQTDIYKSPVGEIFIAVEGENLCFLDFYDNNDRIDKFLARRHGNFKRIPVPNVMGMRDRLERYFSGDWGAFDDIDLSTGGTDFQKTVWQSLRTIPVGKAISYNQLAENIKRPKSVRAVANANANNPIAVIIPCHRVIGKDGTMRGYAGGVERKVWLLNHEGAMI